MKQHTLTLLFSTKAFFLCTIISLLSCVNNIQSDDEENPTVPITLSTKIQQNDKSNSEMEFKENDEIGVYMFTSSSSLDRERYASNIRFIYSESIGFIPERELLFPESNEKYNFLAYYPYQNAGIPISKTTMEIDISPDQSELNNFTKSDFMTAQTEDISPTDNSISLTFSHKLYRLNIIIKPGTGYTAEELLEMNPSVTIKNVYTNAIYDFSTNDFSNQYSISDVNPYGEWTLEDGVLTGKSAILIPQKLANQHIFVEITGGGRDFNVITEEYELEKGKAENLIITLVPNHEELKCTLETSIEGWGEPKKKEVIANEIASYVDITTLTFTESNVYQVLNRGIKVAEICKEYLLADNINKQAIVVYPVQNGITNMKKGLVAFILEEVDQKHGGSVAWNADNSVIYTAGNSLPLSHIYVSSSGNIETTRPADALKIQVKPEVITDTRVTETTVYPIVKIATQYWMRGNLKAGKYTDGSSILKSSDFQNSTAKYFPDDNYFFYNSAAVNTTLLSPVGWRVGTTTDWQKLEDYIQEDAAVLKNGESWKEDATAPINNLSGFNAAATGYYKGNSFTSNRTQSGFWKTDDESHRINGYILLHKDYNYLRKESGSDALGLTVRCIRE